MDGQCELCRKPIAGWETFGDVNQQLCFSCYCEVNGFDEYRTWIGIGPHRHDLSKTGGVFGSTVFEELAQYAQDEHGRYIIGPHLRFTPEDKDGVIGIWEEV
jgi:hypothetical protein